MEETESKIIGRLVDTSLWLVPPLTGYDGELVANGMTIPVAGLVNTGGVLQAYNGSASGTDGYTQVLAQLPSEVTDLLCPRSTWHGTRRYFFVMLGACTGNGGIAATLAGFHKDLHTLVYRSRPARDDGSVTVPMIDYPAIKLDVLVDITVTENTSAPAGCRWAGTAGVDVPRVLRECMRRFDGRDV